MPSQAYEGIFKDLLPNSLDILFPFSTGTNDSVLTGAVKQETTDDFSVGASSTEPESEAETRTSDSIQPTSSNKMTPSSVATAERSTILSIGRLLEHPPKHIKSPVSNFTGRYIN